MASAITHFIVGAALALPATESRAIRSVLPAWAIPVSSGLLAVAPDLDTLAMRGLDIPYGSFFGHRGFFHSPFFLILLAGCLAAIVVGRRSPRAAAWLGLVWAGCAVTHPLLDALTDGGSGVMLLFPFSSDRWFFAWRPIHVSPLGIQRFFARAGYILRLEMPFCLAAAAAGATGLWIARLRHRASPAPPGSAGVHTRRQCLFLFGAGLSAAPPGDLSQRWREIAAGIDGTVGASALHLASGRKVSFNGEERFPMASVCKLPIALHTLAMVDEGKLSRGAAIEVLPADVVVNVSEVAARWPKQKRFPLDELLQWMVAKSDNTAVETLYRIGGRAPAITARLRGWRVEGIRIDRSERQCLCESVESMPRFLADPRDTATPDGTVGLFARLYRGELLSAASTARIIEILEATTTGPARIKGLLPGGVIVAHKTGTTGTARGLNGATNDVGVITLPQGAGQLALAVYVKGSRSDLAARERIIARIARAAFDATW